MTITLQAIQEARHAIAGSALRTPLLPAPRFSALTGAQVSIKYENLQVTGSFKERGALTKLRGLSAAEREKGVIAMSAGNHAQAVAYHAGRLEIPATIVMPAFTPLVKVAATERYGATVILEGETLGDAETRAEHPLRAPRERGAELGSERGGGRHDHPVAARERHVPRDQLGHEDHHGQTQGVPAGG